MSPLLVWRMGQLACPTSRQAWNARDLRKFSLRGSNTAVVFSIFGFHPRIGDFGSVMTRLRDARLTRVHVTITSEHVMKLGPLFLHETS